MTGRAGHSASAQLPVDDDQPVRSEVVRRRSAERRPDDCRRQASRLSARDLTRKPHHRDALTEPVCLPPRSRRRGRGDGVGRLHTEIAAGTGTPGGVRRNERRAELVASRLGNVIIGPQRRTSSIRIAPDQGAVLDASDDVNAVSHCRLRTVAERRPAMAPSGVISRRSSSR
jgi:hypothetical protein